jgi:hypothetical protein
VSAGAPAAGRGEVHDLLATWETLAPTAGRVDTADPGPIIGWLREALDAAIRLEFATIPPYLCALWSIVDQDTPVAGSIRRIVQEEMLHMALACNMLAGLGGTPRIADPAAVPRYPGRLPGGVHRDLVVPLNPLDDAALDVFILIELPEKPDVAETDALKACLAGFESYLADHETIGTFYDKLKLAFDALAGRMAADRATIAPTGAIAEAPPGMRRRETETAAADWPFMATDRQMAGPLSWFPVRSRREVDRAVNLIKHQGEGSDAGPAEYEGETELAHFYRFLEIRRSQRIGKLPDSQVWGFVGPMSRPEVFPMAQIPAGGYPRPGERLPPAAADLLTRFDQQYTVVLQELQATWADGDQGRLVRAIEAMFGLQASARALMEIPRPDSPETTYGPCFRFTA